MSFPYSIYNKFSDSSESATQQREQSYQSKSSSSEHLDSKTNRAAKNIANLVIKNSSNKSREKEVIFIENFQLPPIPKDILLFGSIILAKIFLYAAYREANKAGMEITEI